MKRLHTCIIILLLTLIVTAMSHAETVVKPFQQDIPDLLKPAFSGDAWEGYICLAGALHESNFRDEYPAALVVMKKDSHTVLCGAEKREGTAFQVYELGENAVYQDRMPVISGSQLRKFTLRYDDPAGGYEEFRYCLIIGDHWRIMGYTRKDPDGSHFEWNTDGSMLLITQMAQGITTAKQIPVVPFSTLMEFLDVRTLPKSLDEAMKACQNAPMFPQDIVVVDGRELMVNLRQGPSTKTPSLGKYYGGTIMHFLSGGMEWSKVQIGSTVGYISNNYLAMPSPLYYVNELPLPYGRIDTEGKTALYIQPDINTSVIGDYEKGQTMHVLAVAGDWVHVCIPSNDLGWYMDENGAIGYMKADKIKQFSSLWELKSN